MYVCVFYDVHDVSCRFMSFVSFMTSCALRAARTLSSGAARFCLGAINVSFESVSDGVAKGSWKTLLTALQTRIAVSVL